jgi:hypothetical protein
MKRPDNLTFYRLDFLRAALQIKGAAIGEIDTILAMIESLAPRDEFAKWNKQLDEPELRVLSLMLQPKGAQLADTVISKFFQQLVTGMKITSVEIEGFRKKLKLN